MSGTALFDLFCRTLSNTGDTREAVRRVAAAARAEALRSCDARVAERPATAPLTVADILERIADVTGVSVQRIKGPSRVSDVMSARRAAYVTLRASGLSYPAIANATGRICHSSVINGVKAATKREREIAASAFPWMGGASATEVEQTTEPVGHREAA